MIVYGCVYRHSGFWDAYSCVRCFLHAVIRREYANASLGELPHLYFTGHSLGGALATLASVDVTLNSMPRIKKYLEVKRFVYGNFVINFCSL